MSRFLSIFASLYLSIVALFDLSSPSRTPYVSEQTRNLRLDVLTERLEDCLSSVHMECSMAKYFGARLRLRKEILFFVKMRWAVTGGLPNLVFGT